MLPESIDCLQLILELNKSGWKDYKIEQATGLPVGYIAALKSARVKNPRYETAALIYNFHEQHTPRGTENLQCVVVAPT